MPTLIPTHLFRPVPLPHPYVKRNSLTARLLEVSQAKVVVIKADAGYGKSVAVADFVRDLVAPAIWYPLEHLTETTTLAFIGNLVRAVQTVRPQWGRQVQAHLLASTKVEQQFQDQSWLFSAILPMLVAEFQTFQDDIWLVLENHHLVRDQDKINEAIAYLLNHSLPTIKLIITSRSSTNLEAHLDDSFDQPIIELKEEDLALSLTESQVLAHKYGLSFEPTELETIFNLTSGHPFLCDLIYQYGRDQGDTQTATLVPHLQLSATDATKALFSEILATETPSARHFLLQTAILPVLTPTMCNRILEIDNAVTYLNDVNHTLLRPTDEGVSNEPHFVHRHDLIRDFLKHRLHQEYKPSEVNHLYLRLGHFYAEQRSWDQAIATYCQGKAYDQARQIILDQAQQLIDSTQHVRLEQWLEAIPPDSYDPYLLVYQGIMLASQRNLLAEQTLLQAKSMFEEAEEWEKSAWATLELSWFYCLRSESARGIELLQALRAKVALNPQQMAQFFHYLGACYHDIEDYTQAFHAYEQAIDILRRSNSRADRARLTRIFRHFNHVYRRAGLQREAIPYLKESKMLCQSLELGDFAVAWANNQLAMAHYYIGEFQQAHHYLDEADPLLAQYRDANVQSPLLNYVLIARGHLYQEAYQYDLAETLYRQAEGTHLGVFAVLNLVQPKKAREAFEQCMEIWQSEKDRYSVVVQAKFQVMLGIAYLVTQQYEEAKAHLSDAAKVLKKYGVAYDLVTCQVYLAKVYQVLGDSQSMLSHLKAVFGWMAQKNQLTLDIWHPWIVAEMAAEAVLAEIELDFIENLMKYRIQADHARPFFNLLNDNQTNIRQMTKRILDHVDIQAHVLLEKCRAQDSRDRFTHWLTTGWLTDIGLISLKRLMTWRQIDVFLLWSTPYFHGSIVQIASEAFITKNTVNSHVRNIRPILTEQIGEQFTKGQGGYAIAYQWAIDTDIINPHIDFSLPSPKDHT
ncbi:MAG: hypothetical protein AAF629_31980 [Chloroflexota bacterium]